MMTEIQQLKGYHWHQNAAGQSLFIESSCDYITGRIIVHETRGGTEYEGYVYRIPDGGSVGRYLTLIAAQNALVKKVKEADDAF